MTDMQCLGSERAILEHLATGVFTTNERRSGKNDSTMIAVHLTTQASERINNGDLRLTQFALMQKKTHRSWPTCPVGNQRVWTLALKGG